MLDFESDILFMRLIRIQMEGKTLIGIKFCNGSFHWILCIKFFPHSSFSNYFLHFMYTTFDVYQI